MVEVFKTNVVDPTAAEKITFELNQIIPMTRINFDLDDCDRILRVEVSSEHAATLVQKHVQKEGFICEVLE
ncbi:MAG: hypothetical protein KF846_07735 [Cyclobacteriaceae bacterium]|nr:hypothetical protein [Cyclobacteriaceae bacterium]MBX2956032.1 hypothetical protein [Cyclobacteriaceae bacterium]